MYRLFVALPLPEQTKNHLAILCNGLPGVLWRDPEQMHLTLRFIGQADGALKEDIHQALSSISGESLDLILKGVEFQEAHRQPKVIQVGVKANDQLVALQTKVESALRNSGLELPRRKFHPHVTIGRFGPGPLKSNKPEKLANFLSGNSLFEAQPFLVDRFVLYSSIRTAGGPAYVEEAAYPLDQRE